MAARNMGRVSFGGIRDPKLLRFLNMALRAQRLAIRADHDRHRRSPDNALIAAMHR